MPNKPVEERLQVKGNRRLAVVGAPSKLEPVVGAPDVRADVPDADVVLMFCLNRSRLDAGLPSVLAAASASAILWIAYPKLTSDLAQDLSRDIIHDLAPSFGLDTVSQIAIDDDWSALRLKRIQ
jgi:hypothetical protein